VVGRCSAKGEACGHAGQQGLCRACPKEPNEADLKEDEGDEG